MDEQSHYYRAIQISNGDVYKNDNGNMALFGGMVSENQQSFMDYFIKMGLTIRLVYISSEVVTWKYSSKTD